MVMGTRKRGGVGILHGYPICISLIFSTPTCSYCDFQESSDLAPINSCASCQYQYQHKKTGLRMTGIWNEEGQSRCRYNVFLGKLLSRSPEHSGQIDLAFGSSVLKYCDRHLTQNEIMAGIWKMIQPPRTLRCEDLIADSIG